MSSQINKKKNYIICNICREKLTKNNNIKCPLCKQFFCIKCIESWLLRVRNNMICPFCAKKWDIIFICHYLPLKFIVDDLKLQLHGKYTFDYEYETQDDHQEGGTNKSYFETIDDNIDEETIRLIKLLLLRNIIS